MTTVQITISNDPITIGDNASREDLEAYGKQLAEEMSLEFNCDCYYSLASCIKSSAKCSDSDLELAIQDRVREIECGDQWIEVLERSRERL